MAQHDWFRNTFWTPQIEAEFFRRLGRARDKSQHLRIQASCLAESHPEVALILLDKYFACGERIDLAQAHVDRARAFATLGDHDAAAASYEAALAREHQFPNVKTHAYLDFAQLVVNARIERFYARALEVLDTLGARAAFPVDRYRAHGARALLLQHFGRLDEAKMAACSAMEAARETESGFRKHRHLGLVRDTENDFGRRVATLAT